MQSKKMDTASHVAISACNATFARPFITCPSKIFYKLAHFRTLNPWHSADCLVFSAFFTSYTLAAHSQGDGCDEGGCQSGYGLQGWYLGPRQLGAVCSI